MYDNYGDDSGKLGETTQLVGCARDAHAVENLKEGDWQNDSI